ncbi:hypothetical protein, partial [Massilia sp. Root351]|uniref:hypothetical protein n=1 Tax=Massilia sp. Root351 TaxID=1736522 RepID=UPI001E511D3D
LRLRHHHQTPTLIDCKFLKNSALLLKRFVQQQRDEIMGRFVKSVNPCFPTSPTLQAVLSSAGTEL